MELLKQVDEKKYPLASCMVNLSNLILKNLEKELERENEYKLSESYSEITIISNLGFIKNPNYWNNKYTSSEQPYLSQNL